MGTHGLPDTPSVLGPATLMLWVYISGKPLLPHVTAITYCAYYVVAICFVSECIFITS